MVDLLTIHGPVRDPYLSEFSERYDLDSGCSVESTLRGRLGVEDGSATLGDAFREVATFFFLGVLSECLWVAPVFVK